LQQLKTLEYTSGETIDFLSMMYDSLRSKSMDDENKQAAELFFRKDGMADSIYSHLPGYYLQLKQLVLFDGTGHQLDKLFTDFNRNINADAFYKKYFTNSSLVAGLTILSHLEFIIRKAEMVMLEDYSKLAESVKQ